MGAGTLSGTGRLSRAARASCLAHWNLALPPVSSTCPMGAAGGGADGGGGAASPPAAAAARPAGGGAALHLAYPTHQGGSGSHRADAADRGAAIGELATRGLVSPGVRAPACPAPYSRSPSFWLTRWTARSVHPHLGERGWCASGAPSRPNGRAPMGWRRTAGSLLARV
jgi:hypothetical protein